MGTMAVSSPRTSSSCKFPSISCRVKCRGTRGKKKSKINDRESMPLKDHGSTNIESLADSGGLPMVPTPKRWARRAVRCPILGRSR